MEVPWSRGKEREKSIFKKIKIFVSLELRMKRNDQKALVSGGRRVTPRSQTRRESSRKPGCVLASIPAHPQFLGQTNSWLSRYVWEAWFIFQPLELCPELLNYNFSRSYIQI